MFDNNTTVNSEDGTAKNNFAKPLVMGSAVFNEDCMLTMKRYPDKIFDLAIVDPPYGLTDKITKGGGVRKKYNKQYDWDNETPNADYFNELFRVSKNQIIWGANYFLEHLGNTRCVLTWDKMQEFSGADFELAWTSFDKPAKTFRMSRVEAHGNGVIHPTQKPVKLYDWVLKNYSCDGDLILDTHLGSGSNRIACYRAKRNFVGCEISKEYFDKQEARFKNFISQQTLW